MVEGEASDGVIEWGVEEKGGWRGGGIWGDFARLVEIRVVCRVNDGNQSLINESCALERD